MIAASTFTSIFGVVPAGDPDRITRIARAACQVGYAVVVCKPGGKQPMCTLSARQLAAANREAREAAQAAGDLHAGRRRHACGLAHAITDPDKAARIVARLVKEVGHVNLGLELGASRLVCVDVDTPSQNRAFLTAWSAATGLDETGRQPTVASPGACDSAGRVVHSGGGHYWFGLPDGCTLPPEPGVAHGEGDWSLMWARRQVLIPPSVRREGPYRLVGQAEMAPAWLIEMIRAQADVRVGRAELQRKQAYNSNDPIERWSAGYDWAVRLPGYGWTDTGLIDACGCPIWTAPGDHASPKSATAHEAGCARYDTDTGWGPLHLWTDDPPQQLRGQRTWTKLAFVSAMEYGGDVSRAVRELGLHVPIDLSQPAGTPAPESPAVLSPGVQDTPSEQASGRTVELVSADRITTRRVRWGWKDRMPIGEMTLVPGREGIGKSLFLAWLAGQLTRGQLEGEFWGQPRPVLYAASEDSWAYTIAPRMSAAGADLSKVTRVAVRQDGQDSRLILPMDCGRVAEAAKNMGAAALMLDPVISLIDDRLSVNQSGELRRALEPLRHLAEDADLMVVALVHLNKTTDVDTLSKITGSRAWAEVARAAFAMVQDRENDRFVAGQIKNNLGRLSLPHLVYSIESATVATSDGPADVGRLVWTGESDVGVEEVQGRRSDRGAAEQVTVAKLIIELLRETEEPMSVQQVAERLPEIKPNTVAKTLTRLAAEGTLSKPRYGAYEFVNRRAAEV